MLREVMSTSRDEEFKVRSDRALGKLD